MEGNSIKEGHIGKLSYYYKYFVHKILSMIVRNESTIAIIW